MRERILRLMRSWWLSDEQPDWRAVVFVIIGGLLLSPLVNRLPMPGYDWAIRFYPNDTPYNVPWIQPIVAPLRWLGWREALAVVNSITMVTVATATARAASYQRRDFDAVVLALLTPPLLMTMWDGQVDGLALLGMLGLPWLVPLVLMRPHFTVWPILTRRNWTIGAALFGVLSLIIWGWWPGRVMAGMGFNLEHPIALGWGNLGWPVGVLGAVLLLFSGKDIYQLLAAGSLAASYVMPYHYTLLLPSIGRVRGWKRIVLWVCAWLTIIGPAFADPTGKYKWSAIQYLGLAFPLAVWFFLRTPRSVAEDVSR